MKTGTSMKKSVDRLNQRFQSSHDVHVVLDYFLNHFGQKLGFASSMGAEDQVLTDFIAKINPQTKVFTLDTGRLPKETHELIDQTRSHYPELNLQSYFPRPENIEKMVAEKGLNLFYDSVENRKLCCYYRKVEPLQRALSGLDGWITGLRREQSESRSQTRLVEFDEDNGILKINPLIYWTEEDVWKYIRQNKVPYNRLHNANYSSIGCAPCTRAVPKDGSVRDGRWWWESTEHKECGLHRNNREVSLEEA
jgi:phosphoadenosine phosphosulfate reductase